MSILFKNYKPWSRKVKQILRQECRSTKSFQSLLVEYNSPQKHEDHSIHENIIDMVRTSVGEQYWHRPRCANVPDHSAKGEHTGASCRHQTAERNISGEALDKIASIQEIVPKMQASVYEDDQEERFQVR